MLKNYFKLVLRNFIKYKSYSFINIIGLAIGMACFILILLWVLDELSYDRFHEKANEIYRVISDYNGITSQCHPGPLAGFLKAEIPEITQATRLHECEGVYQYEENILRLEGLYVGPEFLDIFTFPLISGEARNSLNEPGSIIITEATAKKIFGNADPIGKVLKVDMKWTAKVAAVIQNVPKNSSLPLQFDYLAPFKIMFNWRNPDSWTPDSDYNVYVLLAKNSSAKIVTQKINDLLKRHQADPKWSLFLQPLTEAHLYSNFNLDSPHGDFIYVFIFSCIALLILAIACINYMNLTTARSVVSAKEVAVRKVVGADQAHLIIRFFCESFLFTSLAFVLALILAGLLLPQFNLLAGKDLVFAVTDTKLVLMLCGLFIFTSLLSGLYPAIFLSSFNPVRIFKKMTFEMITTPNKIRNISFRKLMVITQFTISIIVMICALSIYHQLNYIKNKKLGFESEKLIYLPASWNYDESSFTNFRNELLQHSGIVNVANSDHVPNYDIVFRSTTYWYEHGVKREANFRGLMVGYDFLDTYRMELARGRFFSREFSSDRTSAFVINEAAARTMGMSDPLGKELEMYGRRGHIIGVVKDFHFENMHKPIEPVVFTFTDHCIYLSIKLVGEKFAETIDHIQRQMKTHFPEVPFEYHFWDDTLEQFYRTEQRMGQLFTNFSILAIFISCLGIMGLASFLATKRTKEMGIRKVLGASVFELLKLLAKDFTRCVIIANGIAWPIAFWAMEAWLRNFAYRTTIGWWWSFLAAGIFSLVIALLAISGQVIPTAMADPAKTLRYE